MLFLLIGLKTSPQSSHDFWSEETASEITGNYFSDAQCSSKSFLFQRIAKISFTNTNAIPSASNFHLYLSFYQTQSPFHSGALTLSSMISTLREEQQSLIQVQSWTTSSCLASPPLPPSLWFLLSHSVPILPSSLSQLCLLPNQARSAVDSTQRCGPRRDTDREFYSSGGERWFHSSEGERMKIFPIFCLSSALKEKWCSCAEFENYHFASAANLIGSSRFSFQFFSSVQLWAPHILGWKEPLSSSMSAALEILPKATPSLSSFHAPPWPVRLRFGLVQQTNPRIK